ncbi:MAG: hypothetical protein IT374_05605 [Polyangiaceae bacterium]|nr:hypothetical protein [Polyangiaceae bacterium]
MRALLLSVCACVCLPACRREPPPEPAATAAPAPEKDKPTCPSWPDWAKDDDPSHLVAELLYLSDGKDPSRKGSGQRLYDNGMVVVWDELEVTMKEDDDKPTSKVVPGRWSEKRARLPERRVEEVVKGIAALPRDELVGVQGKERSSAKHPSFVTVRVGAERVRSCYRDQKGSASQRKVEELMRGAVGEASEASKKLDGAPKR